MSIILKTPAQIQKIKDAGIVVKKILDQLDEIIAPGVTTKELDDFAARSMQNFGVISATLGYRGFPASICTSVNHVICHGIPNNKRLKAGDIINVDVTVIKNGWHGDSSRMYYVGEPAPHSKRLVKITKECLDYAIEIIKPGIHLNNIGYVIQNYAEKNGYSVVRDYCGHGIGESFHEEPQVLHYGKKDTGMLLEEGMTFTIEPMINMGTEKTKLLADQWTVVTKDRRLSAQWEHTIAVVKDGVEILTL